MINILKTGRLGNNLFQFAFAYVMARKMKTDFIFDTSLLNPYFVLGNYNDLFRKRIRRIRYLLSLKFTTWKKIDLNLDIEPEEIIDKVTNNAIIYGYFQSYKFFQLYENEIRSLFKIKEEHHKSFMKEYGKIFDKPVICIAIRLADYQDWKINEIDNNTPELSLVYFRKTINLIPDIEKKNIVFISDEIETIKKEFDFPNSIFVNEEINQLLSLVYADYIILSNSTFQWWGAWLNVKPSKVIYAPKYWLGHKVKREYPKDIIPDEWIKVDVT